MSRSGGAARFGDDLIPLYLASTSPARLALLRQIGIEPVVVPSHVNEPRTVEFEEQRIGRALRIDEVVATLARAKAEAVADSCTGGLVLGGDSAFLLDGEILGKPHTPERATARWRANVGKTGTLWSGLHVIDTRPDHERSVTGGASTRTDRADVQFADDISAAEIDAYVASGEPLSVAGAFTIDGFAAPLITRIDGAPSAVIGLSLPGLRVALGALAIRIEDLRGDPS